MKTTNKFDVIQFFLLEAQKSYQTMMIDCNGSSFVIWNEKSEKAQIEILFDGDRACVVLECFESKRRVERGITETFKPQFYGNIAGHVVKLLQVYAGLRVNPMLGIFINTLKHPDLNTLSHIPYKEN